jgi:hypothetical protein
MPNDEPEITQIAKFIATRIPTEGVAHTEATDGWRGALRYARNHQVLDEARR